MHSHKIPPEDLEGERAESVESLFSSSAVENFEKVVFIPLFLAQVERLLIGCLRNWNHGNRKLLADLMKFWIASTKMETEE